VADKACLLGGFEVTSKCGRAAPISAGVSHVDEDGVGKARPSAVSSHRRLPAYRSVVVAVALDGLPVQNSPSRRWSTMTVATTDGGTERRPWLSNRSANSSSERGDHVAVHEA